MSALHLNATTRAERHAVTGAIAEAIQRSGGWIIDFHHFSNQSLCINFEIEAERIGRLKTELESLDLRLSDASRGDLAELQTHTGSGEITGTLQITFVHGEPDLRREIPPIPG